jgi:hypothetical protein
MKLCEGWGRRYYCSTTWGRHSSEYFLFLVWLELELRSSYLQSSTLQLDSHLQYTLLWLFWRWSSVNYLGGLILQASQYHPPKQLGLQVWATSFRPSILLIATSVLIIKWGKLSKTLTTCPESHREDRVLNRFSLASIPGCLSYGQGCRAWAWFIH